MRWWQVLSIVLHWVAGFTGAYGQCPVADFALPETACMNEELLLSNSSTGAVSYFWDYCKTDLREPVSVSHLISANNAFRSTFAIDFVRTPEPVVLALRNGGELMRVPLSQDLKTAGPPVAMEGLSNAFSLPRAIRTVKEGNNYYALVTNANNGQSLTVIDFGTAPGTTASFKRLDGIGVVAVNGIDIISDATGYDVFVGQNSGNLIYHLRFSGSITGTPSVRSFTVPGAASINDIKVLKTCDGIIGIVSSLNNDKLFRLDFSNSLANTPVVLELTYTGEAISEPAKFGVAYDNGEYFLLLHTNQGRVHRLSFGSSILDTPVSEILWSGSLNGYDLSLFEIENRWKAFFVDYSVQNRRLSLLEFADSGCQLIPSSSRDVSPTLKISSPGEHTIALTAFSQEGFAHTVKKSIVISEHTPATIDFSSTGMCLTTPVTFSSISDKGVSTYEWTFGDGNTSSGDGPSHQYSDPGEYSVSLLVTDTDGCKTLASDVIKIYQKPGADFLIPSGLLCTNNEFTFSNSTIDEFDGNLSYTWYVDNVESGALRDLNVTFTSTGAKEIRLLTSIPGCFDEVTKTTTPILTGPDIDFAYAGVCADDEFAFELVTDDQVQSIEWDFGNGEVSTDGDPITSYSEGGDFSVSLTATNDLGCETVERKSISVHTNPLVNFDVGGPPNACAGSRTTFINETVNLDERPIAKWFWEFDDLLNPATADLEDGVHQFSGPGNFKILLTARTAAGCAGSMEKTVVILPSPTTVFSTTPVCEDKSVVLNYSDPANISSIYWEVGTHYYTTPSLTHTFPIAGDYPLLLEVKGSNGCIATLRDVLHVPVPLSPEFSVQRNCVGEEAVITDITIGDDDPVKTRQWEFQGGLVFSESPLTYIFDKEGSEVVTLTVTTESGCSYSFAKTIEVTPRPLANFVASPSTGAHPLEVAFANMSIGASTFDWQFGDESAETSDQMSPLHTFLDEGMYTVTLTASNEQGCQHSFSSVVQTLAPLPDVDIEMINLITNSDGSTRLIATIHNKGNTVLEALPIDIDFDGQLKLRQTLSEPVLPSRKFNFVLNTSIVSLTSLRYLCVSLDLPGDLAPRGNQLCKQLDNATLVLPAYPNPTEGMLHVEWMSPVAASVRLSVIDAFGRNVLEVQVDGVQGMNQHVLDLSMLDGGMYSLVVDQGKSKRTQRVVLNRR